MIEDVFKNKEETKEIILKALVSNDIQKDDLNPKEKQLQDDVIKQIVGQLDKLGRTLKAEKKSRHGSGTMRKNSGLY